MLARKAEAEWHGNLMQGKGQLKLGSGAFTGGYSFSSRFEEGQPNTNPEELLAASHAGCFTMALDAMLTQAGYTPTRLRTQARVFLNKVGDAFEVPKIELHTEAEVPGLTDGEFQNIAANAKANCPISKALAAVEIHLSAILVASAAG